jgi:hypothetical protein
MNVELSRQEIQDIYVALATQRDELINMIAHEVDPQVIMMRDRHLAATNGLMERFSALDDMLSDWESDVDYSY